jgi:hypothetical protein
VSPLPHQIFSSTRNGGKSPFEMGEQKFNPLIWLIPAICDSCATTAMYIGLTMTYASSFQMLRGSVVIFTGLCSFFLLRIVSALSFCIGGLLRTSLCHLDGNVHSLDGARMVSQVC